MRSCTAQDDGDAEVNDRKHCCWLNPHGIILNSSAAVRRMKQTLLKAQWRSAQNGQLSEAIFWTIF
jgi:hypothetical protein